MKRIGIGGALTAAALGIAAYAGRAAAADTTACPLGSGHIKAVQILREPSRNYTARHGAVITVQRTEGLTAEALQTAMEEHLAQMAAGGSALATMKDCPLALQNVAVHVVPGREAFDVQIRSYDDRTAAEIWKRVDALTPEQLLIKVDRSPRK